MEPVQILLFIVVGVLTGLLVFVGAEVILLLRELKRATVKINKILDDAHLLSSSVAKPIVGLSNFIEGANVVKSLLKVVSEKLHPDTQVSAPVLPQEPTETVEMTQMSVTQNYPHISSIQERGRRFFHKDGKPLTS